MRKCLEAKLESQLLFVYKCAIILGYVDKWDELERLDESVRLHAPEVWNKLSKAAISHVLPVCYIKHWRRNHKSLILRAGIGIHMAFHKE